MFNFRFGPNKMPEARELTIERLSSMLKSKAFRDYSLRKLEKLERESKEFSQQLNDQLKAALEQKATLANPNVSKPKLSLKREKPNENANA